MMRCVFYSKEKECVIDVYRYGMIGICRIGKQFVNCGRGVFFIFECYNVGLIVVCERNDVSIVSF